MSTSSPDARARQQHGDRVAARHGPGMPGSRTTRTCQRPGAACVTLAGTGDNAEGRIVIRSWLAHRAGGIARVLLAAGNLAEPRVLGPTEFPQVRSTAWFPTESPRTKRHSPAHGGTDANMPLLALTGLYAGSAGLTMLKLPVVLAGTDLLVSGRSAVRIRSPALVFRTIIVISCPPRARWLSGLARL